MPRNIFVFVILALSVMPFGASAQKVASSDNMEIKPKHSPHKASIYSAVLPGLGQAYNKKYWKIPIVYAGFGTITYFVVTNRKEYLLAKEAFLYTTNGEVYETDNKYVGKYTEQDLTQIRDYYRRNTELSWIVMSLWYVLNIVDATVDAHFFDYDISDNLSLHLQPSYIQPQNLYQSKPAYGNGYTGLSLSLRF